MITKEMHKAICDKGTEIWHECYNKPRTPDEVGEITKTTMTHDGKSYELEIDSYWDRSSYFDYHIKGHGIDERKLVAKYI